MKKFVISVILLLAIFSETVCFADSIYGYEIPVTVAANGVPISTDIEGFIYNDLTYVPIRPVANALYAHKIDWDFNTEILYIGYEDREIMLDTKNNICYINGVNKEFNGELILYANRLCVPLRLISEMFGCNLEWDGEYYFANLSKAYLPVRNESKRYDLTKDNIFWLARIIEAESSGEPFEGKIAVGNVVMNRVKSDQFPNTIYEVIFDKKYGTQFQPVKNGTIYNTPSRDSIIAAKEALLNVNVVGNSLYFLNVQASTNFWIVNNRKYVRTIKNHDFYL